MLSFFFLSSLLGHANDFPLAEDIVGARSDISAMETLEIVNPENSPNEESRSADPDQESDEPETHVLSQKLVEGVGDPTRIDAFEKGLYVEENLLEGDFEKRNEEEKDTEKKKKEFDQWLRNAATSDVLNTPDPLAENDSSFSDSLFDAESIGPEADPFPFEEIPL